MTTPQKPVIFTILRQYGITQQDIAHALHISRPAVTQWASGTRQMARPVTLDLAVLVGLILEGVQHGRDPRDALQHWRPRSVVTEGGGWQVPPVALSSGPIDIPPPVAKALLEAKDSATREGLHLQNILDQLDVYRGRDPIRLTMADLMQLQHLSMALETLITMMAQRKARELEHPGEEGP